MLALARCVSPSVQLKVALSSPFKAVVLSTRATRVQVNRLESCSVSRSLSINKCKHICTEIKEYMRGIGKQTSFVHTFYCISITNKTCYFSA